MITNQPAAQAPRIDPSARIDPTARIAADCVIKSGACIGAAVRLDAGVRVDANVVFVDAEPAAGTQVKRLARIGANSSIYPGVVIAERAEVRPGSVVTRSVPPNAIVEGNPANIVGYVDAARELHHFAPHTSGGNGGTRQDVEATAVRGVTVHHFPIIPDLRGNLTVGEFDRQVPFLPKRYFMVFGVPSREIRGEHAHFLCHQFLICLRGSCAVVADDGVRKVEIELDAPNRGLYLPPMTWGIQYKYSPDALVLVFASDYYDAADYIRDYDQFIAEVGATA